jgi:hypothetical protein
MPLYIQTWFLYPYPYPCPYLYPFAYPFALIWAALLIQTKHQLLKSQQTGLRLQTARCRYTCNNGQCVKCPWTTYDRSWMGYRFSWAETTSLCSAGPTIKQIPNSHWCYCSVKYLEIGFPSTYARQSDLHTCWFWARSIRWRLMDDYVQSGKIQIHL